MGLISWLDSAKVDWCGGWSKRRTLFGGDQFPAREQTSRSRDRTAKIRAFLIHLSTKEGNRRARFSQPAKLEAKAARL